MADTCPLDPPRGRERQVVPPSSRIASLNGDILITSSDAFPRSSVRWIIVFFTRDGNNDERHDDVARCVTWTLTIKVDIVARHFLDRFTRSSETRDSPVCDEPSHRGRLREESRHAKTEAPRASCGRLDELIRHDMTDQFTTSSVNQALFPGQISAIFLSFPQSSHESTRRRCGARGVTLYNRG